MKKTYQIPVIQVINIPSSDIICTSITTDSRYSSGNNAYIGFGSPWAGEID